MTFLLYNTHGPVEAIHEATAVTVGVFDGVHLGHQTLIRQLGCRKSELAPLVVTLTAHPSFVLGRHQSEYWLDDPDEHQRLLFDAGAAYIAVLPFTDEVAQMSACRMASLMFDELNMRSLLLGYDSRFGNKEDDDFALLPQLAEKQGFVLQRGESCLVDGSPISSSRIRESLLAGDVGTTATLLGRHYTVSGTVQHGRGVGHTLGFPTANIDLTDTRKMLPSEGVYAVSIDGRTAVANLGTAPTFGVAKPLLEVHIIDWSGDLYGRRVDVRFTHRLRDTVHFDTVDALRQQLQHDINQARLWT